MSMLDMFDGSALLDDGRTLILPGQFIKVVHHSIKFLIERAIAREESMEIMAARHTHWLVRPKELMDAAHIGPLEVLLASPEAPPRDWTASAPDEDVAFINWRKMSGTFHRELRKDQKYAFLSWWTAQTYTRPAAVGCAPQGGSVFYLLPEAVQVPNYIAAPGARWLAQAQAVCLVDEIRKRIKLG